MTATTCEAGLNQRPAKTVRCH